MRRRTWLTWISNNMRSGNETVLSMGRKCSYFEPIPWSSQSTKSYAEKWKKRRWLGFSLLSFTENETLDLSNNASWSVKFLVHNVSSLLHRSVIPYRVSVKPTSPNCVSDDLIRGQRSLRIHSIIKVRLHAYPCYAVQLRGISLTMIIDVLFETFILDRSSGVSSIRAICTNTADTEMSHIIYQIFDSFRWIGCAMYNGTANFQEKILQWSAINL